MLPRLSALRPVLCLGLVLTLPAAVGSDDPPRPLRALLVTGGCCHDYGRQAERLVERSRRHARIEWTVLRDERRGTRGRIDLYDDEGWAEPYDVIVHNECFADTADADYIRRITAAHRAGAPAVVIHCAMHTYRAAEIDDWREFLGVTSRRHEHQSEYPVSIAVPDHPILTGFPLDWKSPRDELYVIDQVWPGVTTLATSKSERDGREHPVFWVHEYGDGRVFGTTFGHGNATFEDPVFLDTVTRGLLWAADKLGPDGRALPGYEAIDWSSEQAARLPASEKATRLFDGRTLAGWSGKEGIWSVEDGAIVGRNEAPVATSTYLFSDRAFREFRLLFEVRQTRSEKLSTMHSAVAVLGERFEDRGDPFGFRGPLLMFCQDWGIWDAHRRNRICPASHRGTYQPTDVEHVGDWNRIEVLVRGDRIRFVANGRLVFDFTDDPKMLRAAPIALQVHSNSRPQEFRFRGLIVTESPTDELITLEK